MPHGASIPFLQIANLVHTFYQEIMGVRLHGRTIVGGLE